MMANNYESLKTDGHYTMARRIFTKIKSWVSGTFVKDVSSGIARDYTTNEYTGYVFTKTVDNWNYMTGKITKGDNINFDIGNSNKEVIISSDQIEDSYDYDEYEDLPSATKMLDKLFICEDAPAPSFFRYNSNTKTLIFENGYATYDEDTKTLTIGG